MSREQIILLAAGLMAIFAIYRFVKSKMSGNDGDTVKGTARKFVEDLLGHCKLDYLPFIIAYVVILLTVALLYPKGWNLYWGKQTLFWMTQLGAIAVIALGYFKVKGMLWFRIAIIVLLVGAIRKEEWPKPDPPPNGKTGTRQGIAAATTNVRSVKVIAYPGNKWSQVVQVPYGYDGSWRKDPIAGMNNVRSLVEARANRKIIRAESMTGDGRIQEVYFPPNTIVYNIEFRSLEKHPVYLILDFVKKG